MNATSQARSTGTNERARLIPTALALAAVIAVALGVRAYRLDAQSVWFDDYNGLAYLGEPSLKAFLGALYGPYSPNVEHVPLYFIIEYFWGRCFGVSPTTVRLLSICFGLLTIPLVYLLGRDIFGRGAGLVGALCFALSPLHIFHDQGIRPYSLMVLLAAASVYALLRASRGQGSVWWVLNLAANILLLWTHLFGVFLLFAEGCFLLVFFRHKARRAVVWIAVNALASLPCALWVRAMRSMAESAYEFYRAPTGLHILYDLVGDDAINVNGFLLPSETRWESLPAGIAGLLLGADRWLGYALVLFFCACTIWLLWKTLRLYRRPGSDERRRNIENSGLLLMLVFLPVFALAVLSYVWRPCIFPRYTLYSSLALYVIVGGAVQSIPRPFMKRLALAILVLLYGYQLALTVPATTRTNWVAAAEHVQADISPDDVIFAGLASSGSPYAALDIFRFHMGESEVPVLPAHSLRDLCDKSACLLARRDMSTPGAARNVWGVLQQNYSAEPLPELENCLASRSLEYSCKEFQAMECLIVYRIMPPSEAPAASDLAAAAEAELDCAPAYAELGMAFVEAGHSERALSALRAASELDMDYEMVFKNLIAALVQQENVPTALSGVQSLLKGRQLAGEKDYEKAAEAFRKAVASGPDYALARWELGAALTELGAALAGKGDYDGALGALHNASELGPDYAVMFENLMVALLDKKNVPAALDGVQSLREGRRRLGKRDYEKAVAAFREALASDPNYALAYEELGNALTKLGTALAETGDYDGALEALRNAIELDQDYAMIFQHVIEALIKRSNVPPALNGIEHLLKGRGYLGENDEEKALAAFRQAAAAAPRYALPYWEMGYVLMRQGDYDGVIKAMRKHNELNPNFPPAYAALGLALMVKGDFEASCQATHKAFELAPEMDAQFGALFRAMAEDRDCDAAWAELARLREAGAPIPPEVIMVLERECGRTE